MQIPKGAILLYPQQGKWTMQVALCWLGSAPEMEEVPDGWIVELKDGVPVVGKQIGYHYLTRAGWNANRDAIKQAFDAAESRRLTWAVYEANTERWLADLDKSVARRIGKLEKDVMKLKSFLASQSG